MKHKTAPVDAHSRRPQRLALSSVSAAPGRGKNGRAEAADGHLRQQRPIGVNPFLQLIVRV